MQIFLPKYSVYVVLPLMLLAFNSATGQTYDTIIVKKTITQLQVDSTLASKLDSLIEREIKCSYYDSRLLWFLLIREVQTGAYAIDVTMKREVVTEHEYSGFFRRNKTLFLVSGPIIEGVFSRRDKQELEFTKVEVLDPGDLLFFTHPEDYSVWVYIYHNDILSLGASHPLPCQ